MGSLTPQGYIPDMELDRDDILAIQELYGRHEDPHDTTRRVGRLQSSSDHPSTAGDRGRRQGQGEYLQWQT